MQGLVGAIALVLPLVYIMAAVPGASDGNPEDAAPSPSSSEIRFPDRLVDISGNEWDVAEMAREDNLVLVTMKRPDCPVCLEQLVRLRERLPELEACGVRFIVLAPGPTRALERARKTSAFPYPFVVDVDLSIAKSLGLARPNGEVFPCMLQILPDRRVGWRQLGRNGFYFGDAELKEFFDCSRAV